MTDYRKLTVSELREKIYERIQTKASDLNKEDLIRLIRVLDHDFGLGIDDAVLLETSDHEDDIKEILTISAAEVLSNPINLKDGWSADVRLCPKLNFADIYAYLILKPSNIFNNRTLRAYKSLDSYLYVESDGVKKVQIYSELASDWKFVKAEVDASQSDGKIYFPWILLHKANGTIRGGQCSCKAGPGQTCSHLGALLFLLERVTTEGINRNLAPTEIVNQWKKPAEITTGPARLQGYEAVKRVKQGSDPVQLQEIEETTGNQIDRGDDVKEAEDVDDEFVAFLERATGGCRLFQDIAPRTVFSCTPENYVPPLVGRIETFVSTSADVSLPLVRDVVRQNFHQASDQLHPEHIFMAIKAAVDDKISKAIEEETRKQSNDQSWYDLRKGRVKASMAVHRVYTYYNIRGGANAQRHPTILVDNIITGGGPLSVAATRYGIENEDRARRAFESLMRREHPNINVQDEVGFKIAPGQGHVGASVDGLVRCNCGDCPAVSTLEIKCPITIEKSDPNVPEVASKIDFLKFENGEFVLNKGHKYYFQVQTQLASWGLEHAYFFVYSPKGCRLFNVKFDTGFWNTVSTRIDNFYMNFVVPEMMTRRLLLKD